MIREWTSDRFGERYRTMRLNSGFEISHYYKPFSLQAAFCRLTLGRSTASIRKRRER